MVMASIEGGVVTLRLPKTQKARLYGHDMVLSTVPQRGSTRCGAQFARRVEVVLRVCGCCGCRRDEKVRRDVIVAKELIVEDENRILDGMYVQLITAVLCYSLQEQVTCFLASFRSRHVFDCEELAVEASRFV